MLTKKTKKHTNCTALHAISPTGFTLVEVIIVIAVIGLLGAIGYPSLSKWVPNYQLKTATQEMYADFQKAKMHAAKANKDVTFTITISATCTTTTGYTFSDGVDVVASKTMVNGVCIDSAPVGFTNGTRGFDSRGLPLITGGTVSLKHPKISRKYEIIQSPAGRIKIN